MMYSSKTVEMIGCTCYDVPEKFWFTHYGAVEPGSAVEPNYECFEHFPHTQHNPPNKNLVHFRQSKMTATEYLHYTMLNGMVSPFFFENEHAREVLNRLARMEEANASR